MALRGIQQTGVQSWLVTQQKQPLGIGVEPPQGIGGRGKTELGQRAMTRAIRAELREHSVRFVECEEQVGLQMFAGENV